MQSCRGGRLHNGPVGILQCTVGWKEKQRGLGGRWRRRLRGLAGSGIERECSERSDDAYRLAGRRLPETPPPPPPAADSPVQSRQKCALLGGLAGGRPGRWRLFGGRRGPPSAGERARENGTEEGPCDRANDDWMATSQPTECLNSACSQRGSGRP